MYSIIVKHYKILFNNFKIIFRGNFILNLSICSSDFQVYPFGIITRNGDQFISFISVLC